jgi:hypothetical protein
MQINHLLSRECSSAAASDLFLQMVECLPPAGGLCLHMPVMLHDEMPQVATARGGAALRS